MKKIVYLFLILVLITSGTLSVSADISPMGISHYCHSGIYHEYCDLVCTITRSCGCEYQQYKCCCGYSMPIVYVNLCSIHQSSNGVLESGVDTADESNLHEMEIPVSINSLNSTTSSTSEVNADEAVIPMAIAHPCHNGTMHLRCEWWKFSYTCGCENIDYECCCGLHMADETKYCSKHSWTNPPFGK